MKTSKIYSPEELSEIEKLEHEIKPLTAWIKANKHDAPPEVLGAKNSQLMALLQQYNAVLDKQPSVTFKTT